MAKNWALVVGINQYTNLRSLKFAKRDAELFKGFLEREAHFDQVFYFSDDSPQISPYRGAPIPTRPTYGNLRYFLRAWFDQAFLSAGDNFWFFFSGHGMRHADRDYLMPCDADPGDVEHTAIPISYVTERLRRCGADNVVLVLDACRSEGEKSGLGIGAEHPQGVISLFSCSPNEASYEIEELQQGAFTYALLQGLRIQGEGNCATVERLYQYLRYRVPEVNSRYQKPRQTPYTIAEPATKLHLILLPEYATVSDIATLKNDAYRAAQIDQDLELSEQLWQRVIAATRGQDQEALEAYAQVRSLRSGRPQPPAPTPPPQPEALPKSTNPFAKPSAAKPSTTKPSATKPSAIPALPTTPSPIHPSPTPPPTTPPTPSPPPTPTPWTRQRFLKWAGFGGTGAVLAVLVGQTLKNPNPSPTAPSPTAVDYTKLKDLLQAKNWKAADQETTAVMLKLAGREKEGWLDLANLARFPCDVLSQIDQLWVTASGRKFGFSVQKKIYLEVGGELDGQYDGIAWNKLSDRVGWRRNGNWVTYENLGFDLQKSPTGELPTVGRVIVWGHLFSRAETCRV